jgi:hypothetical protein
VYWFKKFLLSYFSLPETFTHQRKRKKKGHLTSESDETNKNIKKQGIWGGRSPLKK